MRSIVLTGAMLLAACTSTPHISPNQVTASEVATYKNGVEMGCREQGKSLGHPAGPLAVLCKCVVDTLNARLTAEEWRRVTFYAQNKRGREEAEILEPHLLAVRQCK